MNRFRTQYQPTNPSQAQSDVYRYGFNGKEIDSEGMGGGSSTYDYGFRIYNAQLGKFLSVDPLTASYPWYTPYQFAGNKPIWAIDLDGLEEFLMHLKRYEDSKGNLFTVEIEYQRVPLAQRARRESGTFLLVDFDPRHVDVDYQFLLRRRNEIQSEGYERELNAVKERSSGVSSNRGLVKLGAWKLVIGFENNKGIEVDEIHDAVLHYPSDFEQTLDEVISYLAQDANVEVTVTGSASPLPTDIRGRKERTSRDHNAELAQMRADAAKEYIIKRAVEEHGASREEIESRIVTDSKVVTGEDGNNDANKRSVTIEVTKR